LLSLYGDAEEILEENWARLEWLVIGAMQYGPVLTGGQVVELIEGTGPRPKRRPLGRLVIDRCKTICLRAAGAFAWWAEQPY